MLFLFVFPWILWLSISAEFVVMKVIYLLFELNVKHIMLSLKAGVKIKTKSQICITN